MPMVIGALKRLDLIRNHPEFQEKLWENVRAPEQPERERFRDRCDQFAGDARLPEGGIPKPRTWLWTCVRTTAFSARWWFTP